MLEIRILKKNKTAFPQYSHNGKIYVEGVKNEDFYIEIKNNHNKRVEVVGSIDGRDIVSGKEADYKSNQGYIINPYETQIIKGYRLDDNKVGQFTFADKNKSFSVEIANDNEENVGVFGFAEFEEIEYSYIPTIPFIPYQPVPYDEGWWYDWYDKWNWNEWGGINTQKWIISPHSVETEIFCSTSKSSCSGEVKTQNLGTTLGNTVEQKINYTFFTRKTPETPNCIYVLYYDDEESLISQGIKQTQNKIKSSPNPFPGIKPQEDKIESQKEFDVII